MHVTGDGAVSMARSLVTGASGYVGSRLVRELHALGEPVGCVARDPSRVSFDPAVTVHQGDMLAPSSLSAIGDGYSHCVLPRPLDGPWGRLGL